MTTDRLWMTAMLIVLVGMHHPAAGQALPTRMVIASNVACRAAPHAASAVAVRYGMGDLFLPRGEAQKPDGSWYLDTNRTRFGSSGCWLYGPLTADWSDPERALLAAAARVLARTDQVPFEDFVAVDNLLNQTRAGPHADTSLLELSPILQLRRVQLLERAARAQGTFRTAVRRDPLKAAWFHANRDVLQYFEPAGGWLVTTDSYWRLFERHRSSPFAESIAWVAARAAVPSDECDAPCILDRINRTYARYWMAFPNGPHVNEALANAQQLADYATRDGCFGGNVASVTTLTNNVRASLGQVTATPKTQLLTTLSEVERRCGKL